MFRGRGSSLTKKKAYISNSNRYQTNRNALEKTETIHFDFFLNVKLWFWFCNVEIVFVQSIYLSFSGTRNIKNRCVTHKHSVDNVVKPEAKYFISRMQCLNVSHFRSFFSLKKIFLITHQSSDLVCLTTLLESIWQSIFSYGSSTSI